MLRLLPVTPPLPVHCSNSAQPSAISSILFSPTFLPAGPKTSQWPTQKSNWRCSLDSHGLDVGLGKDCADAGAAASAIASDASAARAASRVCVGSDFMTRD